MQTSSLTQEASSGLFPHLCNAPAVFGLVLAGELLALALVLVDSPLVNFSWMQLGYVSMVVQWVVLMSAVVLCGCSSLFLQLSSVVAGSLAYLSVLSIALIVLCAAQWLTKEHFDWMALLKNMLLAAIFSGIFLRYLYLQQQLRRQQQAELQARIQALHARIRPHFLFNSMNAIASLIPVDPELAEKVVEDLSRLFRVSLQESSLVSLKEEMVLCRSYIAIEQVRLGGRLQVEWQCEDYPATAKIPSLALQPLIENAIYHGIQPLPTGGVVTIKIVGETKMQRLSIIITNPVPPVDYSARALSDGDQNSSNQVALKNIEHRLQAHYGQRAFIKTHTFCTQGQDYYRVTLQMPIHTVTTH